MSLNHHTSWPVALAAAAWLCIACAAAADVAPVGSPRAPQLCEGCGTVFNVRRMDKPVARERNTLPSISAAPSAGGMGNTVQTVPLFSIGSEGAHRVRPESAMRSFWEISVRYDNGSFGFVTLESEPELKVGDRVRYIENTLELLIQPAR